MIGDTVCFGFERIVCGAHLELWQNARRNSREPAQRCLIAAISRNRRHRPVCGVGPGSLRLGCVNGLGYCVLC